MFNKPQYNAFTTRYNRLSLQLRTEAFVIHDKKSEKVISLWDTGASGTSISKNLVLKLDLKVTGRKTIKTPSGTTDVNTYLLDIALPNKILVRDVLVCDSEIGDQGFDLLIGMDIISLGDFCVSTFQKKTTLSFRIPSKKETDYVPESNLDNKVQGHGPGKHKK